MWPRFFQDLPPEDDGTVVLTIGTVISKHLVPKAALYIVFSSGLDPVGPPDDFGKQNWRVVAVRGPISAHLLGLPKSAAVTDGAALLNMLPECAPLPESSRHGVVFMPHYSSLDYADWKKVSELAGIEFLDAHAPSEETTQRIRSAKLVIADAMHSAIVADTLRVPWIPVATSPQINSFKWLDWTMSLGLPYKPVVLPYPSLLESLRCLALDLAGERSLVRMRSVADAEKHYGRVQKRIAWKHQRRLRWYVEKLTLLTPQTLLESNALMPLKQREDQRRLHRAADALRKAAGLTPYLSDENIFRSRVDELASRLDQVWPHVKIDTVKNPTAAIS